ncbi:MAG: aminotransferase class IV [marine benthic group bacterium]|nr:aminotransferase class IV [Candidatus Benthicola marisminoris]
MTEFRPNLHDRAFRYGDGVFATLAIRAGTLLEAEAHTAQLGEAAAAVGLEAPSSVTAPESLLEILRLLGVEADTSGTVRIQLSAAPGGRGFGRPVAETRELVEVHPAPAARELTVAVLDDGEVPPSPLPAVKTCSALPHVLCAVAAARRGCAEALRVDRGFVLETSAANVFWVNGGELFTPAAYLPLYPGCTRSFVIEAARALGWTVHEGAYAPSDLDAAEGMFLVNAARGLERVSELEGRPLEWPSSLEDLRSAIEAARDQAGLPVASTPGGGD